MNRHDQLVDRVSEVSALLLDGILTACQRLDIVPRLEQSVEGTYVLDANGRKVATLRVVVGDESLIARMDVRCDRLRRAMTQSEVRS